MPKIKIYAVYKNDEFLVEGTSKECAKYLGITDNTVRWYNTQAYKRRCEGLRKSGKPKNRICVISLEEE